MKKLFPLLFILCLFGFVACDSDEKETLEIPEAYGLKSIIYSLEEGDGKTTEPISLPTRSMSNQVRDTMKWSFDPMGVTPNVTSHFVSDDKNAFSLLSGDSVFVPTPYFYNTEGIDPLPNEKRGGHFSEGLSMTRSASLQVDGGDLLLGVNAYYSEDLQELPAVATHTLNISTPPNKKSIVSSSAKKTEFRVTYTAIFVGKTSGTEVKVKGKWVGTQINNLQVKIEQEDITPE